LSRSSQPGGVSSPAAISTGVAAARASCAMQCGTKPIAGHVQSILSMRLAISGCGA
jgi:hypothetical protein